MMRFWRWFRKNDNIFSMILGFAALAILFFAIWLFWMNKSNPNDNVILDKLGYQPIYVQTGSMEPTMKTKSIVLVEKVDSMEDIAIDDIITYQVYDETGKTITITHRIYNIKDDGTIITKGDNNRVADSYTITIDNVRAKVVHIWNWFADFLNSLATTSGKVMLAVVIIIIILIFYGLGQLGKYLDEKYGINDDEEDTVNDRLLADYEDEDDEDDDEPRSGKKNKNKQELQLLEEDRNNNSWEKIYNYKVSDDNLVTITGVKPNFASITEITVPKEIKHKKVVGIGVFAFRNSKATIINLPETLEFIERAAFYHAEELIYVDIPNSVMTIGANAFDGCKSLIDIKLPINLTKIEDKTFKGCLGLNTITIHDKVTFIGDSAFYGCDNLNTIYGAQSVQVIKLNAFKTSEMVETNLITNNECMLNYDWNSYGRNAVIVDDQGLLDVVQEENQNLKDEYEKRQEELRIQKEQQLSTKIGRQLAKFGEKKTVKKSVDSVEDNFEELLIPEIEFPYTESKEE